MDNCKNTLDFKHSFEISKVHYSAHSNIHLLSTVINKKVGKIRTKRVRNGLMLCHKLSVSVWQIYSSSCQPFGHPSLRYTEKIFFIVKRVDFKRYKTLERKQCKLLRDGDIYHLTLPNLQHLEVSAVITHVFGHIHFTSLAPGQCPKQNKCDYCFNFRQIIHSFLGRYQNERMVEKILPDIKTDIAESDIP